MSCRIQIIAIKTVPNPIDGSHTSRCRVIDIVSPDADNVYYLITYSCDCGVYITKDLKEGHRVSWFFSKGVPIHNSSRTARSNLWREASKNPIGHELQLSSATRILPHKNDYLPVAVKAFKASCT